MRVVHVYKDYYPVVGGIENYLRLLTSRLRQIDGIDARVLVTSPTSEAEHCVIDGVPVFRAGRLATVASTPLSLGLIGALRALRPDIVHLQFPYPMGELAYMLAAWQTPCVITYQSDIVRQKRLLTVYRPLMERLLARADAILPTSPQYLDSSPWLQPHRERCQVVPLGMDSTAWHSSVAAARPEAAALRRRLSRSGDTAATGTALILFVGRFRYYKGLHFLLDALPHIRNAQLILVGGGPEEGRLRSQAAQLGISERATFAGDIGDAELPAYYAAADLFVFPSCARSEAFGIALMEAEAAGLACVSTELGTATSWINQDGVTGRVVPPGDPAALAGAINELLADPTRRAALGAAAQQRIATHFDIDTTAATVAGVYRRLLDRPGSSR